VSFDFVKKQTNKTNKTKVKSENESKISTDSCPFVPFFDLSTRSTRAQETRRHSPIIKGGMLMTSEDKGISLKAGHQTKNTYIWGLKMGGFSNTPAP